MRSIQSQLHLLGELSVALLSSRLLAALSKMFTPTHISFIVLELHCMLALSKSQLHFEILSKFLEAKHG